MTKKIKYSEPSKEPMMYEFSDDTNYITDDLKTCVNDPDSVCACKKGQCVKNEEDDFIGDHFDM
jgi:hypothetical protein